MSVIENTNLDKHSNQKRISKKNTVVDLTPMVDLGFLLITFFVFTTQLLQPTAMNLNMPYDKVKAGDEICASCVLTLFLQSGNSIRYYEGMPESNPVVRQTSFGTHGIREIILNKKRQVQRINGRADDFVLIIKAADESTFQNFVDIVDEVAINSIKHYYLDEISEADKKLFSGE
ncbi:MAG: biopolymer transporter ExbD [Ferruginibacter sp.]|nr:biopolymer transporter ExbD [Ferruginibacter sp.]